ncbi:rhodanese-like domain-containing protein, partial [uncultured Gimesia sp.]|uniref:rhodanese-like domain-containing protein n=1 Tax=uncultured Gimesia sp. TaxID=1678688 RepID=UPI0026121144
CGKGLGAIPSSTVGYEKIFNPSLQYTDEQAFVQYILSDQPEAPKYFAVMKRVNKEGPKIIGDAKQPELLDVSRIASVTGQATVIDLSPSSEFAAGHVPGTINIPLSLLAAWAGWIVDYSRPVYLIADAEQLPEALRVLRKIGIDQISGLFETSAVREAALNTERYVSESPQELAERIESGEVTLLDVRSDAEWNTSHIPEARHFFLGRLPDRLTAIDVNQPVVVQCQGGARSAIAAGVLQASGINVINMTGGIQAWQAAGLPTTETAHENLTCSIRGATAR